MKSFNIYLIDICMLFIVVRMRLIVFVVMNVDTEEFKYLAFDEILCVGITSIVFCSLII